VTEPGRRGGGRGRGALTSTLSILGYVVEALTALPFGLGAPGRRSRSGCDDLEWWERGSIFGIQASHWVSLRLQGLRRPGALFTSASVVVYSAVQIAKSEDYPKAALWKPGTFWSGVLVVAGVTAAVGYFAVTWAYARALRKSEQGNELGAACQEVAKLIVDETGVPHEAVGVHVWVVRGLPGARYLDRRAKFVVRRRAPSPVVWRKGKGAMGAAWRARDSVVADVEGLDAACPDEATFCARTRANRFGLTWMEFQETKHYRAILATPLRTGSGPLRRTTGVLSIDVTQDGAHRALRQLSVSQEFRYVRGICEHALGGGSV
jgi:hypothetical protein